MTRSTRQAEQLRPHDSDAPAPESGVVRAACRATAASDEALVGDIVDGDKAAAGVLYERHAAKLLAISARVLRDRSEAEDVVHDAFVTMILRAAQYESERGSVVAWLVTLVRNLSIDRARRSQRRSALQRDAVAHEPRAPVETPEAQAAHAARASKIHAIVSSLPELQRATVEVVFYEGLTYAETAARDRVAIGTLKSRAHRAFASLRSALESEDGRRDAPPLEAANDAHGPAPVLGVDAK